MPAESLSASKSAASASALSDGQRPEGVARRVCSFAIAGQLFAVDASIVREIVSVDGWAVAAVPQSGASLLGLFSLRGTPVPLVDPCAALGIERPSRQEDRFVVLLIAKGKMLVGLRVDLVDSVILLDDRRKLLPPGEESQLIKGYVPRDRGAAIAVLHGDELLLRIQSTASPLSA